MHTKYHLILHALFSSSSLYLSFRPGISLHLARIPDSDAILSAVIGRNNEKLYVSCGLQETVLNFHLCAESLSRMNERRRNELCSHYMTDTAKIYGKTLDYGSPFRCFVLLSLSLSLALSVQFFFFCVARANPSSAYWSRSHYILF